ncbi:unnamed protein product [Gongylonema pulchrum]|uniref:Anaphase-promoting complex subunit 1 n=1 Tax=Gongylonema pulchrum TaxID=637853 RepID=A0A183DHW8_9BILA|nr:unnamed protein product [Gongylonema pulchrum]
MLCPIAEKLEQCERLPVEWPKVGIPFVQPLLELFSDNPLADFSETSSMSAQVGKHLVAARIYSRFRMANACDFYV